MKPRACTAPWLLALSLLLASDASASKLRLQAEAVYRLQKSVPLDVMSAIVGKDQSIHLDNLTAVITEMAVTRAATRASQSTGQSQTGLVLEEMQMLFDMQNAHLQAQKATNQQQLDALPPLFASCDGLIAEGSFDTGEAKIVKLSEEHKECRKSEANVYDEKEVICGTQLTALHGVMTTRCQIYAEVDKIPQSSHCAASSSDANALEWYERIIKELGEAKAYLVQSQEACSKATNEHAAQDALCTESTSNHSGALTQCNLVQESLDQKACATWEANGRHCAIYDGCYDQENITFHETMAVVKLQEESMKNESIQLQVLKCMLATFDMSEEDQQIAMENCKGSSFSPDGVDINYPTVPAKMSCSQASMANKPGTAEYEATHYTGLPAQALAKACTASCCPAPSEVSGSQVLLAAKSKAEEQVATFKAVPQCFSFRRAMTPLDPAGASNTSSILDCQKKCSQKADCAFFTYFHDGRCHLANAKSTGQVQSGAVSGPADCKEVPSSCYAFNRKYASIVSLGDLARVTVASTEECQKLCFKQPGCEYWTLWWDMGCQLAGGGAELQSQAGTVTGPRLCQDSQSEEHVA